MKTLTKISGKLFILIALLVINSLTVSAQSIKKDRLAVLNVDAQGFNLTPKEMGNLVRIQMEKLDSFEVIDRYDVAYLIDKNDLMIDNCYGKICLVETGEIIEADKMFSGSVELYGQMIIISFRLVDVKTGTIEKTHIREFLDLQNELQSMITITINEMFGLDVDEFLLEKLTVKDSYESAINNPKKDKLNLSGPRMGCTVFTGKIAKYLSEPESKGGYDIKTPVMFQYGYQFEVQYLNEANIQALFEIIPNITGLGQGLIIPSVTFMQGIRHNVRGWEIAFGPTFSASKVAKGYYVDDVWYLRNEWTSETPNPYNIISRFDSRGDIKLNSGFLFGIGKSFKSGKLNIPVNLYVIPNSKNGIRFGFSVGFNAKK
jgi:hypothetical protein